jgi:hypothetical protein
MITHTLSRQTHDVDWQNAPAGARWWSITRDGRAHWHMMSVCAESLAFLSAATWPAPDFGYQGDWRDSLTERPETELPSARYCLLGALARCSESASCWKAQEAHAA